MKTGAGNSTSASLNRNKESGAVSVKTNQGTKNANYNTENADAHLQHFK